MGNFDLLEHAGEEAVAKVIAAAEVAQPSEPKERKKKDQQQQQQPDGEGDAYPPENIGQRQGYRRDDGQSRRRNLQDVPKSKPASEAASADQKSEGKVEEPAAEAPQKEAIAANVDATPASESEKSAGDVAKDGPKKPKDPSVKRLTGSQRRKLKKKNPKKEDSNDGDVLEVIEEEKQEMTLEEYEKKLQKKKGKARIMGMTPEEHQKKQEEYKKKLGVKKGKNRMWTFDEYAIEVLGARMPRGKRSTDVPLKKIGVGDHRLQLTLKNLSMSLEPVCIHRKRLSTADRTMAKRRVEGKSLQARHGVRFPMASILTPQEETQTQVSLKAYAYDRSGSSFVVECKKLQSRDSYRIISGWGDFLTENNLVVVQPDAEHEEVVFEVWAFRSPVLEVSVRKQSEDPLGLVIMHYRKGESPYGDAVIADLAAAESRLPELDKASADELQSIGGLVMLQRQIADCQSSTRPVRSSYRV